MNEGDFMLFLDRTDAGKRLAIRLEPYANQRDVIVLALPRGGVAVAHEVCKQLHVPLDVVLVRKLGVPGQEELAMGAITLGDIKVFNSEIIQSLQITEQAIERVVAKERAELERRNQLYRKGRALPNLKHKTVILVDDGIATGATIRAAIAMIKTQQPEKIIVAVPVAAATTCAEIAQLVDGIICLQQPEPLYGIGMWYGDFPQLTDLEVINILDAVQKSQEL
jgi:putative phosphoribosyl transferase